MVAGVNRWHGIGNLTDDPKLSQGDDRDGRNDRCEFSIAINKPSGGDRDREPPPTYLDVVVWGKSADGYAKNLAKGRAVYVEGEIETRSWEDQDTGKKRTAWRIKAWVVRYLDSPRDDRRDDSRREDRRDEPRGRSTRDDTPRQAPPPADFNDLPW